MKAIIYILLLKTMLLEKQKQLKIKKDGIILGVDTVVAFHNKILTKSNSLDEAKQSLNELVGNQNSVITGISLLIHIIIKNIVHIKKL